MKIFFKLLKVLVLIGAGLAGLAVLGSAVYYLLFI